MRQHEKTASFCLRQMLAGGVLCAVAVGAAAQVGSPTTSSLTTKNKESATVTAGDVSWQHLSAAQRQALQPLAAAWPHLSQAQQKKWIALSADYPSLSAQAKERLHARMTEWAALTPKQRTQARLNFSLTQGVAPDDKTERWEVYQSMTAEQKRALAASAPKVPLAPLVKPPKTPSK